METASVVSYSVVLPGCAQNPECHVLLNLVSYGHKNTVSLVDSTCI